MVDDPSKDGRHSPELQQVSLPPMVTYYIRKLLRQNLDCLQSVVAEGAGIRADVLSDLTLVLESLYLDRESVNAALLKLEKLAVSHQLLSTREQVNRQELINLEQEIFWLLGFKPKVPRQQGRLLIVDDTLPNVQLLSAALSQRGYEIHSATSGMAALKEARQIMPDLILLDVMMPGMNGYDVCEQLKASTLTQDIPVIFISAVHELLDKLKGFQVGGVDYITKPFQIDEVLARVENQLNVRSLQKRLERQNVRLQQEIRERKRAEEEAIKSLSSEKSLQELKSRFLSVISQEFKTPLTVIQSSADLLKSDEQSPTLQEQSLAKINTSAQRMMMLLDQILLLEQARTGYLKPNPTWFNLSEFCEGILQEMELMMGDRHYLQFIQHNLPQRIYLDPNLLRQILYNLLCNAINYSPEGSKVLLKVNTANSYLVLHVEDEGVGIPLQDRKHLFEIFYRATDTKDPPGAGLGLALVKTCVELQGGSITVESTVGLGSTFTVQLPL